VRCGCVRPAAFDMANCLRQAERAHHASKYSALGNGRAESLTLPAGQVTLILEADEDSPAHVDALIAATGGSVCRRNL